MALKFKCPKCGEDIIVRFLKVGEVAKCRNCGTDTPVPENAMEIAKNQERQDHKMSKLWHQYPVPENAMKIAQEPGDARSQSGAPYAPLRVRGKVRSFWKVLCLSIVTIGIYFWVYLFITILEMDYSFSFDTHETNPRKVRSILIACLVILILLIILTLPIFLSYWHQDHARRLVGFRVLMVMCNIISGALFVVASSSFVKLIEVCQEKGEIVPLNKYSFWTLIVIVVVIPFVSIGIPPLGYLSLIVQLLLLYLTVKQVNRIWIESRGIGGP